MALTHFKQIDGDLSSARVLTGSLRVSGSIDLSGSLNVSVGSLNTTGSLIADGNISASGNISSSGFVQGDIIKGTTFQIASGSQGAGSHLLANFGNNAIQFGFENDTCITLGKNGLNPIFLKGPVTSSHLNVIGNILLSGTSQCLLGFNVEENISYPFVSAPNLGEVTFGDFSLTETAIKGKTRIFLNTSGSGGIQDTVSFAKNGGVTATINTAAGHITASGNISASGDIIGASISASSITSTGDLTVGGTVTAREFHTEFVSSSIVFQSGSTKFGDTSDDNHNFTGSLKLLGELTTTNNITSGDRLIATGRIIGSSTISGVGITSTSHITASGNISASGNIIGASITSSGNFLAGAGGVYTSLGSSTRIGKTGTDSNLITIEEGGDTLIENTVGGIQFTDDNNAQIEISSGEISFNTSGSCLALKLTKGNITASGNISASGDLELRNITASGNISASGTGSFEGGIRIGRTDGTSAEIVDSFGEKIIFDTNDLKVCSKHINAAFGVFARSVGSIRQMGMDGSSTCMGLYTGGHERVSINQVGDMVVTGSIAGTHITASGNISSSGQFIGDGTGLTGVVLGTGVTNFIPQFTNANTIQTASQFCMGSNVLQFGTSLTDDTPRSFCIKAQCYAAFRVENEDNAYAFGTRPGGHFAFTNVNGNQFPFQLSCGARSNAFFIGGGNDGRNISFATHGTCGNVGIGWTNNTTVPARFTLMGHSTTDIIRVYNSSSAANQLMTFDYEGNLGIGNTSPQGKLHITTGSGNTYPAASTAANLLILENKDSAGNSGLTIFSDNGATGNIYFGDEQSNQIAGISSDNTGGKTDLFFTTNGNNERLRIDGSGNVGIGTDSPGSKLDVKVNSGNSWMNLINGSEQSFRLTTFNNGTGGSSGTYSFKHGLYYNNTENAAVTFWRGGSTTGGFLAFTTNNGSERMRIDASGNVGIGTSSPSTLLQLSGSGGNSSGLSFTNGSGESLRQYFQDENADSNFLITYDGTGGAEITLKHDGDVILNGTNGDNVGIGTSTPNGKLGVSGSVNVLGPNGHITASGNISASGNIIGATGSFSHIGIGGSVQNNFLLDVNGQSVFRNEVYINCCLIHFGTGDFKIKADGASDIIFQTTSSTERMRITDGGNIGIGTATPAQKLQVQGNISASGTGSFSDGRFTGNVGIGTTSPSAKLQVIGASGYVLKTNGNIALTTYTGDTKIEMANNTLQLLSPSGNVQIGDTEFDGNGTSILVDDANSKVVIAGNVGIGTTSPTEKLQVQGNISASGNLNIGGTVTAKEFHTEFVSSSIIFTSGSTKFGDTSDDIHQFTGSLHINGNSKIGLNTTAPGEMITVRGCCNFIAAEHPSYEWGGTNPLGIRMGIAQGAGTNCTATGGVIDFFRWQGSSTNFVVARIGQNVQHSGNSYGLNFMVDNVSTCTTASTSRLYLAPAGGVGIGTTNPSAALHILTDGGSDPSIFVTGSNSGHIFDAVINNDQRFRITNAGDINFSIGSDSAKIWNVSAGGLSLSSRSTEADLYISSSGNVGIGTNNPQELLTLDDGQDSRFLFSLPDASYGAINVRNDNNNASRNLVLQNQGGNVGIGTASPSETLTVEGNISSSGASFSGNVLVSSSLCLETGQPIIFNDRRGIYPTSTDNAFKWILNTDAYCHYAYQRSSDNIDVVFKITDNAIITDQFVFWIDDYRGEDFDSYPLLADGCKVVVNHPQEFHSGTGKANNVDFYVAKSGSTVPTSTPVLAAIASSGCVGIGTNSPSALLHVSGSTTNNRLLQIGSDTESYLVITGSNGHIGAGTSSPEAQLHVKVAAGISPEVRVEGAGNVNSILRLTNSQGNWAICRESSTKNLVFRNNDGCKPLILNNSHITASGNISASGTGSFSGVCLVNPVNRASYIVTNNTHTAQFEAFGSATAIDTTAVNGIFLRTGGAGENRVHIHPSNGACFDGHITASGNISASGTVTSLSGSFSNLEVFDIDASVNPRFSVGRQGGEKASIEVDDTTITFKATQDTDSNAHHKFLFDRVFAGSGRNEFIIQKDGSNQLTIDASGNLTASGNISASGDLTIDNILTFGGEANTINTATDTANLTIGTGGILNLGAGGTDRTCIGRTGNATYQTRFFGGSTDEVARVSLNSFKVFAPITASGNISASGTIIGSLVPQVPKVEYFTVTSSTLVENTEMGLPNSLTYITASGGYEYLEIFADGIRLARDVNYTELDTSSVRYLTPIPSQSLITYKSLRLI